MLLSLKPRKCIVSNKEYCSEIKKQKCQGHTGKLSTWEDEVRGLQVQGQFGI
jgi:hypothetical protein